MIKSEIDRLVDYADRNKKTEKLVELELKFGNALVRVGVSKLLSWLLDVNRNANGVTFRFLNENDLRPILETLVSDNQGLALMLTVSEHDIRFREDVPMARREEIAALIRESSGPPRNEPYITTKDRKRLLK